MSVRNLLSANTVSQVTGVGAWTPTNCGISILKAGSLYYRDFAAGTKGNALQVVSTVAGDISISTEKVSISPETQYACSSWVKPLTNAGDVEITLSFYDVGGLLVDSVTQSSPGRLGKFALVNAFLESPSSATQARVTLTFKSALEGDTFTVVRTALANYSLAFSSGGMGRLLNSLPDYIVAEDVNNVSAFLPAPLLRYFQIGTTTYEDAVDYATAFDYVPSFDSLTGEASLSALTDPWQTSALALPWLAQFVGVRLFSAGVGFSTWAAFFGQSEPIDEWYEWEYNLVPAGTDYTSGSGTPPGGGTDTTWAALEQFGLEFFDSISEYREEISNGYTGIHAGTEAAILSLVKTALNSSDPDPWAILTRHYKGNPFYILVSYKPSEAPDPGGSLVEDRAQLAAPAGVTIFTSLAPQETGAVALEATSLIGGEYVMADYSGNARHLALGEVSATLGAGGILPAPYLAGSGFHYGIVTAINATAAGISATDPSLRALVSNLAPPASGDSFLIGRELGYELRVDTTGKLAFRWYESATPTTLLSTVVLPTITSPMWVRVDIDATGQTATFYTKGVDDLAWTQLGAAVALGAAYVPDTPAVGISLFLDGFDSMEVILHEAQLFDGATQIVQTNIPSEATYSRTIPETVASNNFTVTYNGSITRDAITLAKNPDQHLYLPGTSGNDVKTPDSAALSIAGDFDLRAEIAPNDWTPSGFDKSIIGKYDTTGAYKSFLWVYQESTPGTSIAFKLYLSVDGSTTVTNISSPWVPPIANGEYYQVRVTLDADDLAGNRVGSFYVRAPGTDLSDDTGWTLINSDTTAGTVVLLDTIAELVLGKYSPDSGHWAGKYKRAIVQSGISGTVVFDADFTNAATITEPFSTFVEESTNAATVTINRAATGAYATVVNNSSIMTDAQSPVLTFESIPVDTNTPVTVFLKFRSYQATAQDLLLADSWGISYASPTITGSFTDGTLTNSVSINLSTGTDTSDSFNVVALRRSMQTGLIDLFVNGVLADSIAETLGTFATADPTVQVGEGTESAEFNHIGMFPKALTDLDIINISAELAKES